MPNETWTRNEIRILKLYYADTPTERLIKDFLPDKTYNQISKKASRLGLRKTQDALKIAANKPRKNAWTNEENQILKEYYKTLGPTKISQHLPNRTYQAIQTQAQKLGLTKRTEKKED